MGAHVRGAHVRGALVRGAHVSACCRWLVLSEVGGGNEEMVDLLIKTEFNLEHIRKSSTYS